jgi:hypothetical protein
MEKLEYSGGTQVTVVILVTLIRTREERKWRRIFTRTT